MEVSKSWMSECRSPGQGEEDGIWEGEDGGRRGGGGSGLEQTVN